VIVFGWTAGHRGLADRAPGLGAMNPMTTILCGLTALTLTLPPRRPTFLVANLRGTASIFGKAVLGDLKHSRRMRKG
jgi:hypothetical protein